LLLPSQKLLALGKRVPVRKDFTRIKGAKGLLFVPELLPFGLDQMKRILSATARHRNWILRKVARGAMSEFSATPEFRLSWALTWMKSCSNYYHKIFEGSSSESVS
jgi:hypothetical protein